MSPEYVSGILENIIDILQNIKDYEICQKNRTWDSLLIIETYSLTVYRFLPTRLVSEYKQKSRIFPYTVYKREHTG